MTVRVTLSCRPEEHQGGLFDGDEWQRAAREWAAARGPDVTRWRCDQRFEAGGLWYAIQWDGQSWDVLAVQATPR
jgi:hypothetical protein